MITVTLSDELEAEVIQAAGRKGLSLDDYLAEICKEALSLEVDHQRLQSYRDGTPGVTQERATPGCPTWRLGSGANARADLASRRPGGYRQAPSILMTRVWHSREQHPA